jgi:hypothetical protein
MVRVNLRGFRAIDRRKVAARTAIEWRAELLADLGGAEALTAARMALVESATRTWLYVQHLDAWLLEQPGLVNGRRKGVHPVVRERLLLVESLQRTLLALGLERAQPKAPSLAEIAERIAREREGQGAPQSHEGAEAAGHAAAGGPELCAWREGGDQGAEDPETEQAHEGLGLGDR